MTADAVGGVFRYALDLARAFSHHHVEVCLALMGPSPSRAQREQLNHVPSLQLFESNYALEWMQEPWSDVDAAGDWLLSLAERTGPDVIHINGYSHAALPFDAPVLAVAHSSVPSWWRAVHQEDSPAQYQEYRERQYRGLVRAARVVAPSAAMAQELVRDSAFEGPIHIVRNGADSETFVPLPKRKYIAAAGRFWDEAKNLRALGAVADLPWQIYVAGQAPDTVCATQLVLLGELSRHRMARLLGEATLFVHPALYEPFGLAVLEAALCGCALVLGDIESLRETWGDAALYVNPREPAELRSATQHLMADPELCARLAQRARARALGLTVQRSASAYAWHYRQMCSADETAASQVLTASSITLPRRVAP